MNTFLFVVLASVFLASIMLDHAYHTLPLKELKRRARAGQKPAMEIYKMAGYGRSLEILLWLSGSLSLAGMTVMTASVNGWLSAGLVLAATAVYLKARPHHLVDGRLWSTAAILAPYASWLLSHLQPLLGRLSSDRAKQIANSLIFEKEDLAELLEQQVYHPHNRIAEADLKLLAGALSFSDKNVADILLPSAEVRYVNASENVGPMLMDELHKTGGKYFPVIDSGGSTPHIIGTLNLKELMGHEEHGRVADVMKRGVNYIHETQSLHQLLAAFIKTQSHMFVVTNNFEEILGIVTIDRLLGQIVGQPLDDGFEAYDNLLMVAGRGKQTQAEPATETAEA